MVAIDEDSEYEERLEDMVAEGVAISSTIDADTMIELLEALEEPSTDELELVAAASGSIVENVEEVVALEATVLDESETVEDAVSRLDEILLNVSEVTELVVSKAASTIAELDIELLMASDTVAIELDIEDKSEVIDVDNVSEEVAATEESETGVDDETTMSMLAAGVTDTDDERVYAEIDAMGVSDVVSEAITCAVELMSVVEAMDVVLETSESGSKGSKKEESVAEADIVSEPVDVISIDSVRAALSVILSEYTIVVVFIILLVSKIEEAMSVVDGSILEMFITLLVSRVEEATSGATVLLSVMAASVMEGSILVISDTTEDGSCVGIATTGVSTAGTSIVATRVLEYESKLATVEELTKELLEIDV